MGATCAVQFLHPEGGIVHTAVGTATSAVSWSGLLKPKVINGITTFWPLSSEGSPPHAKVKIVPDAGSVMGTDNHKIGIYDPWEEDD